MMVEMMMSVDNSIWGEPATVIPMVELLNPDDIPLFPSKSGIEN